MKKYFTIIFIISLLILYFILNINNILNTCKIDPSIILNNPIIQNIINNPETKAIINNPETKAIINNPIIQNIINNPETKAIINNPIIQNIINNPETKAIINNPIIQAIINNPETKAIINNPETKAIINNPIIQNIINNPETKANINNPETKAIINSGIINNPIINELIQVMNDKKVFLEERDRRVLYDDFAPPERRVPEYMYPNRCVKKNINISTRGLPENYQILGLALQNETNTVYNIFGRQTFPSSSQYEYYVQIDNFVKIPIFNKGKRELQDGDNVNIEGKGKFRIKLYNFDTPRYNPYIL